MVDEEWELVDNEPGGSGGGVDRADDARTDGGVVAEATGAFERQTDLGDCERVDAGANDSGRAQSGGRDAPSQKR